jgi:DNA-3-methyladenine glycosylase II
MLTSDRSNSRSDSSHRFIQGIEELTKGDRDLAKVIDNYGYPSPWQREPGFSTLVRIILEQQVSYASAQATFKRLNAALDPLCPTSFLLLDDHELKTIGFSRQKTNYGRILAQAVIDRTLDLASLEKLPDSEIRQQLTAIKGIGNWTVDIYLMMALQRQDIFPSQDLAVAIAVQEIKDLPTRPSAAELETMAEAWKPYRAIATKILWHYYLNRKSIKKQSF